MGAICEHCGEDMLEVDGCKQIKPNRIKHGDEERYGESWKKDPALRCHDCGAKIGHYHHPGCDWEECPDCHSQLIFHDCKEKHPRVSQQAT